MKNKNRLTIKLLSFFCSVCFLLLLWELLSRKIGLDFIFPGISPTFERFLILAKSKDFYLSISLSVLRILLGFLLGVLFGIILAVICNLVPFLSMTVSHLMTIIKSTPVASFIMILWVMITSANLPTVIALLMVMPVIWQNLTDGYKSINENLKEVSAIYELSFFKRQKLLVIPSLMNYLIPAMLTSIGLAWKSGIAAEILTYTKNSIGRNIHDAKAYFEGPDLLCWTITVIFISLIFEYSIKFLIERFKKWRLAF